MAKKAATERLLIVCIITTLSKQGEGCLNIFLYHMKPTPSLLGGGFHLPTQTQNGKHSSLKGGVMNIKFRDFDVDPTLIAQVIYGKNPHRTTNKGVVLSSEVAQ